MTGSVRSVPVDGGELAVEVAAGTTGPVLAIHGVSSNRRLWNWLRAVAPELSLVAPDLRGRAASVDVTGPSSLRQHADDMIRVLDELDIRSVDVCGMSMGGFVAVELATAHPHRVRSLTLVDGGLPMAGTPTPTADRVRAAFAEQLGRLDRTWPSVDVYAEYRTGEGSLFDPADPLLRDYFAHDLLDGRVRLNADALLADATDVFLGPSRWRALDVPTELICAEWSTGRDSPPAYPDAALADFVEALPCLGVPERVAGVDHAAVVHDPTRRHTCRRGAAAGRSGTLRGRDRDAGLVEVGQQPEPSGPQRVIVHSGTTRPRSTPGRSVPDRAGPPRHA